MKKAISIILIAAMALVTLVSCGAGNIVGKWQSKNDSVYVFTEDGKVTITTKYNSDVYDYSISGDTITFTGDFGGSEPESRSANFKISGDTLTFTFEGDESVFTRIN